MQPLTYELPVASAQVKSAVLLAGLYADGSETTVEEPLPTRDHTRTCSRSRRSGRPRARSATVWPADGLDLRGGRDPGRLLVRRAVPRRRDAAGRLAADDPRRQPEPAPDRPARRARADGRQRHRLQPPPHRRRARRDLDVRPAELVGTEVTAAEVPLLVDELPLFALLAAHARGDSVLSGAAELRAKETDRIEAVVDGLRRIGAHIRATEDGFVVRGVPARLRGGTIDSRGDHRIAILAAVAGFVSREGVAIEDAEAASVSFPDFFDLTLAIRGFPVEDTRT